MLLGVPRCSALPQVYVMFCVSLFALLICLHLNVCQLSVYARSRCLQSIFFVCLGLWSFVLCNCPWVCERLCTNQMFTNLLSRTNWNLLIWVLLISIVVCSASAFCVKSLLNVTGFQKSPAFHGGQGAGGWPLWPSQCKLSLSPVCYLWHGMQRKISIVNASH